jgi:hypothetical protein
VKEKGKFKMKLKVLSALILLSTNISYAGFNGYTYASRANCVNNESVSWDALEKWDMIVYSKHCRGGVCLDDFSQVCTNGESTICHVQFTSKINTLGHRAAAVHWTEGQFGRADWKVIGGFYRKLMGSDGKSFWDLHNDIVKDCNIYDGWYEYKDTENTYKNNLSVDKSNVEIDINKLPKPNQGIQIVPLGTMTGVYSSHYVKEKKDYIDSDSTYPKILQSLEQKQRKEWIDPKNEKDTYYSGMKFNKDDIKTTFKFNGIDKHVIGYAVGGTFVKNKGWTAINEYFSTDFGVCILTTEDVKAQNGTVQISRESINYNVNNKPGTQVVIGSEKTGFMYKVYWFDVKKTMSYYLGCSNLKYDNSILDKVISFATNIDKQN